MLVAKVHRDRARAEQSKSVSQKDPRKVKKLRERKAKERAAEKAKGVPSSNQVDAFRANRDAAATSTADPNHQNGDTIIGTRRKRSSVLAMIKKRVETLHMNVICREFANVLVSAREMASKT